MFLYNNDNAVVQFEDGTFLKENILNPTAIEKTTDLNEAAKYPDPNECTWMPDTKQLTLMELNMPYKFRRVRIKFELVEE